MKNKKTISILKEVRGYFGFLFDNGYSVQNVEYHPDAFGNWELTLESNKCTIEIIQDRTEILVYFMPLRGGKKHRIGIKAMIYFLSQGKKFIPSFKGNLFWNKRKQYKELAGLLIEYHDNIIPYFSGDFDNKKDALLFAERDYFNALVKSIGERNQDARRV